MPDNEFTIHEPKRSMWRLFSLILALLIVVGFTLTAYFFTKVNESASSESSPANFVIAKGSTTRSIAQALASQKIISSEWSFIFYVKFKSAGNKIQAGNYVLDRHMSIAEIVDVLTAGKVVQSDRRVTVIEGWTNKQIGFDLESRNIVTVSQFDSALSSGNYSFKYDAVAKQFNYQGFLFPDTYVISKTADATKLVQKMLTNFQGKISGQLETDLQTKKLDIKNVIILASIIEKEVGRNKETLTSDDLTAMQRERELVASVFYNRLAIGMPLESDATVNYITGKSDRSVSIADTKIKSPYNTYQTKGLPPTPISNPGLGSIRAAINPAASDYLYFLNKPDGEAVFAKTLAEHNANRLRYLK